MICATICEAITQPSLCYLLFGSFNSLIICTFDSAVLSIPTIINHILPPALISVSLIYHTSKLRTWLANS